MKNKAMDCRTLEAKLPTLLPDMLLDPEAVPRAEQQHVADCAACQQVVARELDGHQATLSLLDTWEAPEVSPYFAARMGALLREEQQRPRTGWLDRARSWLLLTNLQMKPVAGAAALGLLLAIGGGTWLDLSQRAVAPAPQASATVRDLQSLDENAQVFQQMNSLDAADGDGGSGNSL